MVLNIFLIILTIILGLCVGSFLNVVIYRLPKNMSIAKPKSHCINCDYQLEWYDNIPVLSYIILGGKCRKCKTKISPRYIVVELLNAILWFVALMLNTNLIFASIQSNYIMLIVYFVVISTLICVAFCDFENMEIPDEFQIILLIAGIISMMFGDVNSKVFGFILGGGFFALFAGLYYLIKRREGLGFGDIKLMAVLGLILGFENTLITIILSALSGAMVLSVLAIINRKKNKEERSKEYPFAVFIVPSAILAMFVGDIIVNWYLSLFMIV